MVTETTTWGWWASGANSESGVDDIQGGYNGSTFNLGSEIESYGYGEMTMIDGDDDGILSFVQGGGNSPAPGNGDRLEMPDGVERQLYELSIYDNSVYTYTDANGDEQTYVARAVVYQLGNGDLVLRMRDDDRNNSPDDFYIENVSSIQLGTWDGVDYQSSIISNFDEPPPNICYVAGTLIETDGGAIRVENLTPGMHVITADHGPCPVLMVKAQSISAQAAARAPHLRPIRIRAGALGSGLPKRDLLVSPQHRVMVRSKIAQRMFDTSEVLVAAKQLLALDGIEVDEELESFTYVHFLCRDHQIVYAEDLPSESLYLGQEAFKAMSPEALKELREIFPDLSGAFFENDYAPARKLIRGHAARNLAARHKKNRKSILQA